MFSIERFPQLSLRRFVSVGERELILRIDLFE